MKPAEKVRSFRESKDLTQGALGMAIGLKAHQIRDIESGKQKVSETIAKQIEKNFYIPYKNFLFDDDLPVTQVNKINDEFLSIPLYPNLKASCSCGSVVCNCTDIEIEQIKLPKEYLEDFLGIYSLNGVHAIIADGESMEPTIRHGDIIFVSPCESIKDGKVYIINIDDETYCKRVYKDLETGGLILRSDNPVAPEIKLSKKRLDVMKVIGRVGVALSRVVL